jgi:hypothetical protein
MYERAVQAKKKKYGIAHGIGFERILIWIVSVRVNNRRRSVTLTDR